ncbi:uncharacterized protein LOC133795341 [Humulus lupulus]|uniref:uncharacterized protein LOC133795341 n=1 Tax=Humulus lupulus TaxID=3486 RepID=UPI002B416C1E|nr:uncharacterized protein LOC133795341 [Humulus lupulus]
MDNTSGAAILIGDLNGTFHDSKCINYSRQGNISRHSFDLRRMVATSGLVDISAAGLKFTWRQQCKEAGGLSALKRARLDRCLANPDWIIRFHKAMLLNLVSSTSDHNLILLETLGDHEKIRKPFRYENMWDCDPNCVWVVKRAWRLVYNSILMLNFEQRKKATRIELSRWNRLNRFRCRFAKQEKICNT